VNCVSRALVLSQRWILAIDALGFYFRDFPDIFLLLTLDLGVGSTEARESGGDALTVLFPPRAAFLFCWTWERRRRSKRDLLQIQKRPITDPKETYYSVTSLLDVSAKKTLSRCLTWFSIFSPPPLPPSPHSGSRGPRGRSWAGSLQKKKL